MTIADSLTASGSKRAREGGDNDIEDGQVASSSKNTRQKVGSPMKSCEQVNERGITRSDHPH
jgi:hypothetical protein